MLEIHVSTRKSNGFPVFELIKFSLTQEHLAECRSPLPFSSLPPLLPLWYVSRSMGIPDLAD
jgi:hypothetical protein